MKISKTGYIFISLGVILVLGYIIFAVIKFSQDDKDIVCNNLEIILTDQDKITLISQAEIAKILETEDLNPMGKKYKSIRTEKIEDVLHKNPMIKRAECYKTTYGTVKLEITQRTPKFMIAGFENYYIDNDRKLLPVSLSYAAYVPVVSGSVTKTMATGVLFDFVSYLETDQFWNAQIEQIYVRPDQTIELVPRVGDAIIYLGNTVNYQKKLSNLLKLYKEGFNTTGWNRYAKIDLQYENQIVCTRKSNTSTESIVDIVQKNDSNLTKEL